MFSSFAVRYFSAIFFFMAEEHSIVFIHLLIDGYLGLFQFLATKIIKASIDKKKFSPLFINTKIKEILKIGKGKAIECF